MTIPIIIFTLYFIFSHIGLYLFFQKAGLDGWKALIPFYSTYLAVKLINKPIYWVFVYYIPFVGFIVWVGIIVELLNKLLENIGHKKIQDVMEFQNICKKDITTDENMKVIESYEKLVRDAFCRKNFRY